MSEQRAPYRTDVLTSAAQRGTLDIAQAQPPLEADLVELERKLIPLLNRVRALLGKPPVIAPKA